MISLNNLFFQYSADSLDFIKNVTEILKGERIGIIKEDWVG